MKKSNRIINTFSQLSYSEQTELLSKLKLTLSESKPILNHCNFSKKCPHCESENIYKHGKYKNGGTRFQCQDCRKTFNELTGTSIHYIKKKDLWDRFIELMLESKTIRYISKELCLSTKTVFDWRHKVLSSFDEIFTKEFKGVVETDSVFFRFSQKGRVKTKRIKISKKKQVSVLMTMDRYKTYDFKVVKLGKFDISSVNKVLDRTRFNKQNVVCSDSEWTFINIFNEMGLEHKTFKTSNGVYGLDGVYHVNTLNNMISRTKNWINGNFVSVSTKYLSHYLSWFTMLEILKDRENRNDKMWDYLLMDNRTFGRSKMVEDQYSNLLEVG